LALLSLPLIVAGASRATGMFLREGRAKHGLYCWRILSRDYSFRAWLST